MGYLLTGFEQCGKGYDVLLLSAFGYDAYGLDTSDLALEEARKVEKEMDGKGAYETRKGVKKGSVNWVKGDFFKEGFGEGVEGQFDFIYDYTVYKPFHKLERSELMFAVPKRTPAISKTSVVKTLQRTSVSRRKTRVP